MTTATAFAKNTFLPPLYLLVANAITMNGPPNIVKLFNNSSPGEAFHAVSSYLQNANVTIGNPMHTLDDHQYALGLASLGGFSATFVYKLLGRFDPGEKRHTSRLTFSLVAGTAIGMGVGFLIDPEMSNLDALAAKAAKICGQVLAVSVGVKVMTTALNHFNLIRSLPVKEERENQDLSALLSPEPDDKLADRE